MNIRDQANAVADMLNCSWTEAGSPNTLIFTDKGASGRSNVLDTNSEMWSNLVRLVENAGVKSSGLVSGKDPQVITGVISAYDIVAVYHDPDLTKEQNIQLALHILKTPGRPFDIHFVPPAKNRTSIFGNMLYHTKEQAIAEEYSDPLEEKIWSKRVEKENEPLVMFPSEPVAEGKVLKRQREPIGDGSTYKINDMSPTSYNDTIENECLGKTEDNRTANGRPIA